MASRNFWKIYGEHIAMPNSSVYCYTTHESIVGWTNLEAANWRMIFDTPEFFFPLLRLSFGVFFYKWSWFPSFCWIFYFHRLPFWRKVRKIGENISIKPKRGAAFQNHQLFESTI